jgi:tetratricopeptide (TPR) repeat protein
MIAGEPPSRAKAEVLSMGATMLRNLEEDERALAVAQEAVAIGKELGLAEFEGLALTTIGSLKGEVGDVSGVTDLRRAIALLEKVHSGYHWFSLTHLGVVLCRTGDLPACFEVAAEGRRASERTGISDFDRRWSEIERAFEFYWTGRWAEAERIAGEVIADAAAGTRHLLEDACHQIRGRIWLARGDTAGALADAEQSMERAAETGDRQELDPARAFAARALIEAGRPDDARQLLAALLVDHGGKPLFPETAVDLPIALAALHGDDAVALLDRAGFAPTRWEEAVRCWVTGDRVGAAGIYTRIGSRPDEAAARTQAGRDLLAAGRTGEARAQLDAALAFWREVGATGMVRAIERL